MARTLPPTAAPPGRIDPATVWAWARLSAAVTASSKPNEKSPRIARAFLLIAGPGDFGRAGFAASAQGDDGAIWLGDGHSAVARFTFDETARADAAATVETLRGHGIDVRLASGDGEAAVARFAGELDIACAQAR